MNISKTQKIFLIFITLCLFLLVIPDIWPGDPSSINLKSGNLKPSFSHPFGTDLKGRDIFIISLYGMRLSLMIGLVATVVSMCIGVTYGSIAGYKGKKIDTFLMRFVDVLYGLPFMFIVIILMVLVGRSVIMLFFALGAVQWLTIARVTRAEVLSMKEKEFVQAANVLGISDSRIMTRHILPNIAGTILVYTTFTVPAIILEEAFLSFLGLGVPAPMASLGTLIKEGITTISIYPWQLIFPSCFLLGLVFIINRFGYELKKRYKI